MKHIKLFEAFVGSDYRGKDETFCFMGKCYDIQKAWELINEDPSKYKDENGDLYHIGLDGLSSWFSGIEREVDGKKQIGLGVRINKEYLDQITDEQLEEPGIFIDEPDLKFLIDGWHRACKKWLRGDKHMYVYMIGDPKDVKYISF